MVAQIKIAEIKEVQSNPWTSKLQTPGWLNLQTNVCCQKKQKQIGRKFKAENLKGTSSDVDEWNDPKERVKKKKKLKDRWNFQYYKKMVQNI